MNMINCNKKTYLDALSSTHGRGSPAERQRLSSPKGGLFPDTLFRWTEHGRQIALCTWMMVARADVRGKRALPNITLEEQHAIVEHMRAECPGFFSGLLVVEDGAPSEDQTHGLSGH